MPLQVSWSLNTSGQQFIDRRTDYLAEREVSAAAIHLASQISATAVLRASSLKHSSPALSSNVSRQLLLRPFLQLEVRQLCSLLVLLWLCHTTCWTMAFGSLGIQGGDTGWVDVPVTQNIL